MDPLEAISPIDGRYRNIVKDLEGEFSEKALISKRLVVEGEYLIALSENGNLKLRNFSEEEKDLIRKLYKPTLEEAQIVKDIEKKGYKNIRATNHDVKAVEYYFKEKLKDTSLHDITEWIHFGLTSEDTNNIAYGLILSNSVENFILKDLGELRNKIDSLANSYKRTPILARTHGQPASPTTFGKEFKVYSSRLERQLDQLSHSEILVKLNGATGNYNAHNIAFPNVNWIEFTKDFIKSFNMRRNIKLKPNLITTQIEPHDTYAELFDNIRRANTILIDFDHDMWRYISDDWIIQKPVEGEVGSSTMPNKINPIDFENSEGNLGLANALFIHFSTKLPISRLQRDLSDSTVERNFGPAFAHSIIGYKSALKGLSKIAINEGKVIEELENHPEVISEAIQTILRKEGYEMPYEKLKELTRGKKLTMQDFSNFISQLDISDYVKEQLHKISPKNYTGLAEFLV